MNLFVYGTLLVPKIWEAVSGTTTLASEAATLPGFEIRRVRNAVYPGIFESGPEGFVHGRVYFDLPDDALRRLDAYEDAFYLRSAVFPIRDGGSRVPADAYVVPHGNASVYLSDEGWSIEWFEAEALAAYWERLFA